MRLRSPRVALGTGGVEVSQLCFGTEHIIHMSPAEGGRLLAQAAQEHGVTFWDTAPVYHSHPHVAAGLRLCHRAQVEITSKIQADSALEAEQALDSILQELAVEYLDICLLHYVKTGELELRREALHYLEQAKRQGKVRSIGLSAHAPLVIAQAAEWPEIDVVCATFNRSGTWIEDGGLADMEASLSLAHARGRGVYVIKVLGLGQELPDVRGAIEFALARPFIHGLNIGMQNLREIQENLTIMQHYRQ